MHTVKKNMTDKAIQHPVTGQTIMPGQTYAEPDEETLKQQKAMLKAAKATNKGQPGSDDKTPPAADPNAAVPSGDAQ